MGAVSSLSDLFLISVTNARSPQASSRSRPSSDPSSAPSLAASSRSTPAGAGCCGSNSSSACKSPLSGKCHINPSVMFIITLFLVPETYAPTLIRRKAKRLQREADEAGTGEVFIAKYDHVKMTTGDFLRTNLIRPFALLCRELIAACLAIYGAIIYGTLYLFFEAFPIVFGEKRGWSISLSGLSFCGIGVGLILGNCLTPFFNKYYRRATAKAEQQGVPVPPEARLVGCSVGATLLPVGLFWFAWTSTPNVHWIVPIIASVPFGMGFLLIFTGMQVGRILRRSRLSADAKCSSTSSTAISCTRRLHSPPAPCYVQLLALCSPSSRSTCTLTSASTGPVLVSVR